MAVYHTAYTTYGPFVIAFSCCFCQCPRAENPYSCILDYSRPVPSSLQLLHSILLSQRYQLHLSRTSIWSYLIETNNFSVHDAITLYLLGNLRFLYLEFYVHNNPDILTARAVASAPRLSALPSTSAVVTTSSSSTVTFCTFNVSAASRSCNSSGTGSSHAYPQLRKRLAFAS